ncbi:CsbD family protein [Streptomyces sp. ISL-10]|uniref:CsbD family protein n=1 Tax=Streptomyces sp. ISL-10 TaxID=2819172 RepID=UPI001BECDA0B|nr:CsbD family protein [Streptomyces sp. ISL-10]MBT2368986.1 CsbD family protein [Streptomyces sp. ISL-10]
MAKAKGSGADKLKGKAKEAMGKATGDERLKAEGRTDQAKGKAKKAMEDTKERARGTERSLRDET